MGSSLNLEMRTSKDDHQKSAAGMKKPLLVTDSCYQAWKYHKGLIQLEDDVEVVPYTPAPPRGHRLDGSPLRHCSRSLGQKRHGWSRSNQRWGMSREWRSASGGSSKVRSQSREHDRSRESGQSMEGEHMRRCLHSRSPRRGSSGHHWEDRWHSKSPPVHRSHSPHSLQQGRQADWVKNYSFPRLAEVVSQSERKEKKKKKKKKKTGSGSKATFSVSLLQQLLQQVMEGGCMPVTFTEE